MNCTISCTVGSYGKHCFFLNIGAHSYFLFSQNYRRGVNNYFRTGVRLDEALDVCRSKGDCAIIRTMEKLPSYIRYVEREYGITVLRATARRAARCRQHTA